MKNNKGRPLGPSVEILRVLAKYGILSRVGIHTLLGKRISLSGINKSLVILQRKGLVQKRLTEFGITHLAMYQLAQRRSALDKVSQLTGVRADLLEQKGLRYSHYFHEELCAYVQRSLDLAYPESKTIRDWQVLRLEGMRALFPASRQDLRAYPDIILTFKKSFLDPFTKEVRTIRTRIAVEVERTAKTNQRWQSRLDLYAMRSTFDGVLYLTPKETIKARLRAIYDNDVAPNAYRVSHYQDGFLAQAALPSGLFNVDEVSVYCGTKKLTLAAWLRFLTSTTEGERRIAWRDISP